MTTCGTCGEKVRFSPRCPECFRPRANFRSFAIFVGLGAALTGLGAVLYGTLATGKVDGAFFAGAVAWPMLFFSAGETMDRVKAWKRESKLRKETLPSPSSKPLTKKAKVGLLVTAIVLGLVGMAALAETGLCEDGPLKETDLTDHCSWVPSIAAMSLFMSGILTADLLILIRLGHSKIRTKESTT